MTIPYTGFSPDYVYREAKRAIAGAAGTKITIWPGIDIDIPTRPNHSESTPGGTRDAVLAAFRAGASGIVLSGDEAGKPDRCGRCNSTAGIRLIRQSPQL